MTATLTASPATISRASGAARRPSRKRRPRKVLSGVQRSVELAGGMFDGRMFVLPVSDSRIHVAVFESGGVAGSFEAFKTLLSSLSTAQASRLLDTARVHVHRFDPASGRFVFMTSARLADRIPGEVLAAWLASA